MCGLVGTFLISAEMFLIPCVLWAISGTISNIFLIPNNIRNNSSVPDIMRNHFTIFLIWRCLFSYYDNLLLISSSVFSLLFQRQRMQRALDQLFKDAVNRKPKRLSFDTTYSHSNIYDWLQTILIDWTIIIPGSSCSEFALSNWPANGFTRNGVKQLLEEKNHQKPDDLIDGASEPLAYYLSSSCQYRN